MGRESYGEREDGMERKSEGESMTIETLVFVDVRPARSEAYFLMQTFSVVFL